MSAAFGAVSASEPETGRAACPARNRVAVVVEGAFVHNTKQHEHECIITVRHASDLFPSPACVHAQTE